ISVDPPEINREHCRKQGYTYTFLSDPKADVIRAYDLLHEGAGQKGVDISRPAEFLVDSSGTVRWVNLTGSIIVRARPDQILAAWAALGAARRGPRGAGAAGSSSSRGRACAWRIGIRTTPPATTKRRSRNVWRRTSSGSRSSSTSCTPRTA